MTAADIAAASRARRLHLGRVEMLLGSLQRVADAARLHVAHDVSDLVSEGDKHILMAALSGEGMDQACEASRDSGADLLRFHGCLLCSGQPGEDALTPRVAKPT